MRESKSVELLTTQGKVRIVALPVRKGRWTWRFCFVWPDGGEGIDVSGESVAYSSAQRALSKAQRLFTLAS